MFSMCIIRLVVVGLMRVCKHIVLYTTDMYTVYEASASVVVNYCVCV